MGPILGGFIMDKWDFSFTVTFMAGLSVLSVFKEKVQS